MKIRTVPLIVCILIPVGLGALVGLSLRDSYSVYETLRLPPFSPPRLLFPIAWSILYLLMGVSSYLIWITPHSARRSASLRAYAAQLAVNLIWPFIFFALEQFTLSFVWIVALVIFVAVMINRFFRTHPTAAYLQLPYLAWTLYAAYINLGVAILN